VFGLAVPQHVPGVPDEVLLPRKTWSDPAAYDAMAAKLAGLFKSNFTQFQDQVPAAVREAGPRL
jgi:phosphoenolpyruvate carboxykinase (ATP)